MVQKKVSFNKHFANVSYYGLVELTKFFVRLSGKKILNISEYTSIIDSVNKFLNRHNTFVIIGEPNSLAFPYVSKSSKCVTGYTNNEWIKYGMTLIINNHCAADRRILKKYLHIIMDHQKKCPLHEKFLYRYSNTMRLYNKFGYYYFINNQLIFLKHDKQGNPLLTMSIISNINNVKQNDSHSIQISKYNSTTNNFEQEYYEDDLNTDINKLNSTELKILELLGEGYENESIGKKLGYSSSTIKSYRKKMLKKTWCDNTPQLLYHAYRNKLIQLKL